MGISVAIQTGNLGKDVLVKTLPSGTTVGNFSIAENYKYTDAAGVQQEKKYWYKVQCWGQVAINAAAYLKKGDRITVHGRIEPVDEWTTQDGTKVREMHIVANHIEYPPRAANRPAAGQSQHQAPAAPSAPKVPPPPPKKEHGGLTYEAMIQAGWTDETLRANGYESLIPAGDTYHNEVGM